jgi:hypothetical protein
MTKPLTTLAFLLAAAGSARAQEAFLMPAVAEYELIQPTKPFKPDPLLCLRTGFVMGTDAEAAMPFIGAGLRFPIADQAAIEISADYWRDKYADGDAEVTHFPIMFSGMFYFALETPTTVPYIMAGVGLHSMRINYGGALSAEEEDPDSEFSFHGGAGLEMTLNSFLKVHMDVRWIYMDPDPDSAALAEEDFDTVQFTFAIDIRF